MVCGAGAPAIGLYAFAGVVKAAAGVGFAVAATNGTGKPPPMV